MARRLISPMKLPRYKSTGCIDVDGAKFLLGGLRFGEEGVFVPYMELGTCRREDSESSREVMRSNASSELANLVSMRIL